MLVAFLLGFGVALMIVRILYGSRAFSSRTAAKTFNPMTNSNRNSNSQDNYATSKGDRMSLETTNASQEDEEDKEFLRMIENIRKSGSKASSTLLESFSSKRKREEMKLVLLIRTDINMQKGKAAAQCCHAVLENYRECLSSKDPIQSKLRQSWEYTGQPKITLKVPSESEMLELVIQARNVGLIANYIRDAGRTQISAGTKTVAAIGPGPKSIIDKITGHLKLY